MNKQIITCHNCPKRKKINSWTSDGFDEMVDWVCSEMENKIIQRGVEWHEEKYVKVPEWCPIGRQIVIKAISPPKLPNHYTEVDMLESFNAGARARINELLIDGKRYVDFSNWIKKYNNR